MKEILVKNCNNCPFLNTEFNDCYIVSPLSFQCNLRKMIMKIDKIQVDYSENSTKTYFLEDKKDSPITPNWCPLKETDYTIKFKEE